MWGSPTPSPTCLQRKRETEEEGHGEEGTYPGGRGVHVRAITMVVDPEDEESMNVSDLTKLQKEKANMHLPMP